MGKLSEVTEREVMFRTKMLMETMAKNLKQERVKQGLSRTDLAFYAKTTESMICNLENSRKVGISIYTLVKISQALDINIWTLFET
jgi:transcriptional regulator with XRE-family HTH domain